MNTRNLRFRSNRVRDIISLFHEELNTLYGSGEVSVFCEMLFETYLGWDKVKLLTSKEQTINQSDLLRFHWALEDLKKYRPIQHIIGHTDFCGCRIAVSPDVLVPRPETEEMVEWCISQFSVLRPAMQTLSTTESKLFPTGNSHFSILDLCTGSGCIAIALKKAFPEAEVTAMDVSSKALAIAQKNAQENHTDITFLQADLLAPTFQLSQLTFQLIISNPPYIRDNERTLMQRNVLDYDPELALFVPNDDPLCFYRAIASFADKHLAQSGSLVVEINEALADETCSLLREMGFKATLYTDFRGKSRWISSVKN